MKESKEEFDIVEGGLFLEVHGQYQAEVIRYDTIPYDTAPLPQTNKKSMSMVSELQGTKY